jgi:hypothetical protein
MAMPLLDTVAGCHKMSCIAIAPCFQDPQVPQSQTFGHLSRCSLATALPAMGSERLSYPMLACHTGGETLPTKSPLWIFKGWGKCGFVPSLSWGTLDYLVVESLASPFWQGVEATAAVFLISCHLCVLSYCSTALSLFLWFSVLFLSFYVLNVVSLLCYPYPDSSHLWVWLRKLLLHYLATSWDTKCNFKNFLSFPSL